MKLLKVIHAPHGSGKKLVAIFDNDGRQKKIPFGAYNSETFSEGASNEKRLAYIARHKVNEDWSTINAGSLSRYVLWEKPSISAGVAFFKKKYNV